MKQQQQQPDPISKPGSYTTSSYQIHTGSVDPSQPSVLAPPPSSQPMPSTFANVNTTDSSYSSVTPTSLPGVGTTESHPPIQAQQHAPYSSYPASTNVGESVPSSTYNGGVLPTDTTATSYPNMPPRGGGVSREDAKRLHISNIPFKYRENDLMQLFQVTLIILQLIVCIHIGVHVQ